jgi:translation initiation factor 2B subunit (eIF-2B alpha/beta/delta family)
MNKAEKILVKNRETIHSAGIALEMASKILSKTDLSMISIFNIQFHLHLTKENLMDKIKEIDEELLKFSN